VLLLTFGNTAHSHRSDNPVLTTLSDVLKVQICSKVLMYAACKVAISFL
jgi:hypothetical protein